MRVPDSIKTELKAESPLIDGKDGRADRAGPHQREQRPEQAPKPRVYEPTGGVAGVPAVA